ncbi:transmembrane protease serine 9-like isoform X2 [Physella acuta]|uniref:transmembrane protease serine 9-like isoform X2 n=1 Tax=Physella acuta TaxID=109671 RepID=UPI0027DD2DBE|nr:transmembrane protease serine 9-like isoform X2 [Physella acuta]
MSRSLVWLFTVVGCLTYLSAVKPSDVIPQQRDTIYCRLLRGSCLPKCDHTQTINVVSLCPQGQICCSTSRSQFETPHVSLNIATQRPTLIQYGDLSNSTRDQTIQTSNSFHRCGLPARVRRVVGGTEAARGRYPWMVYIARDPHKDDLCGGALVSSRHVITAAHCFDFLDGKWPELTFGEYRRQEPGSSRLSTSSYRVITHPEYDRVTYSYDIALLTLDRATPLQDNPNLNPICLPQANQTISGACTVAGWGSTSRTADYPAVSSPSLMKTSVRVVDGKYCKEKFGGLYNSLSQICAGDLDGGSDSCVGDSGGPLMCGDDVLYLMGVISAGSNPCGQTDTPALYTDVRKSLDWLTSVM